MTQVNCIRVLRQQVGLPIARVAEIMGVSWQTARKYGDAEELPQPGPASPRRKPVMDDYLATIEAWLLEDGNKPTKQRRTARRIYEGLRELGCEASERTVRHYVRQIKQRLSQQWEQNFIRLEHMPGEAQIDFGLVKLLMQQPDGRIHLTERSLLVVSFPYSNAHFCRVLPAQNAECFFYGLSSIFEQIGGVPPIQVFDNLSPAVKGVMGRDRRVRTDTFEKFQWHYRFEARFCNPGSGHEKGHVENKVGYIRRNFLTPIPLVHVGDFEPLQQRLSQQLANDLERDHYRKGRPIKELWDEERTALLTLPRRRFEPARLMSAVTNRYGEISVDGDVYHAPWTTPRQRVLVQVYWDRLKVMDETGSTVLGTLSRRYRFRAEEVDWAAELRVFVHRPRAVEQATYLKYLPQPVRRYIIEAPLGERPQRIATLIDLLERGYTLARLTHLTAQALRFGRTDLTTLQVIAGYDRQPLQEPHTPAAVRNWQPDLGRYNLLAGGVSCD